MRDLYIYTQSNLKHQNQIFFFDLMKKIFFLNNDTQQETK